jgi:magnesium-transporting ATPase (P-type)
MFISMFLGSVTAIFEIMYYAIIKSHTASVSETGLYLFLTFTALIVIFSIRNKDHFWHAPKLSQPMKIAFALITVLSLLLVYFPPTQRLLSFTPLSVGLLLVTIFMTVAYFMVMDTIKVWFYKANIGNNH